MKLFKVLIVTVLMIAAALFYLANNINGVVKDAVVKAGSEALKTPVTLEAVDIRLLEGRVQLSGLVIANIPGFKAPSLLEMKTVVIGLDIPSLLDNLVNVQHMTIDGARVTAEQKGATTNVQVLLNNLDAGTSPQTQSPEQTDGDSPANVDLLIKVGQLNFLNSSTTLISDQWGERDVQIPAIKLSHIGGESGVPAEALAHAIAKPLLKQLNGALKDRLQQLLEDKAKAELKAKVGAKLKEKEQELKLKMDKKLQEKLGDSAVDAIKSLFSK